MAENGIRLIDANALKIAFKCREMADIDMYGGCHIAECFQGDEANEIVDKMPTVDAVEVVHGRWEIVEPKCYPDLTARIRCSACKKEPQKHSYEERGHGYGFTVNSWDATDYCPNCGAKMDADAAGRPEV